MEGKIRTCITSARIQAPTFDGVVFEPTLVNFFYGRNGSGKSTIAHLVQQKQGLTWAKGFDATIPVYLYNEEYIRQNVHSYGRMDGVFTLSETNAGIREEIDRTAAGKAEAEKELTGIQEQLRSAQDAVTRENEQYQKVLWRTTAAVRARYPQAIPAALAKSVAKFTAELLQHMPGAENTDLDSIYQIAFGEEHEHYERYLELPDTLPPEIDLLDIPIVSRSDTGFARFCQALGNIDWLRSGHEHYQPDAGDKCPYCQQRLPEGFEEQLAACYDLQYREDQQRLTEQVETFRTAIARIRQTLTANKKNPFPGNRAGKYRRLADLLLEKLNAADVVIDRKLHNMAEELHMEDFMPLLGELMILTGEINNRIDSYMSTIADIPGEQERCRRMIWGHMAALCAAERERHAEQEKQLNAEVRRLTAEQVRLEAEIKGCEGRIEELNRSIVSTAEAMKAINQMLTDNGFIGFSLREKPGEASCYELIRNTPDGAVTAQGLSEGERHLIAFLYFYHQVMGSSVADGEMTDRIVVIDDPVSSMDSSTMNTVAALTRNIISVCRENTTRSGRLAAGHIKQFFCLTHNPVFFSAVSFACLSDFRNCSFFEVRKDHLNRSGIIPCIGKESDPGGLAVNVSPITNDYEHLWREYFRTDDPATLLNVCRRILCHYFLQTVGYPEDVVLTRLLDENRERFMTGQEEDGSRVLYSAAAAMVSLIEASGRGVHDSAYFDISACKTDQLRYVFREIFDIMDSRQHYDYMTSRLGGGEHG